MTQKKEKKHVYTDAEIKDQYIEYFKDVPVQKYACMAVGKSEDTIIRWKQKDSTFANRTDQAKSEWIRKQTSKVKAEFALERLERQIFGQSVDVTSGGEPITFINRVPRVVDVIDSNKDS